jgi:hypothetical protein
VSNPPVHRNLIANSLDLHIQVGSDTILAKGKVCAWSAQVVP